MAELVTDCPRCGSKRITFDVLSELYFKTQYNWQRWYEAFSVCRNCKRSTVFVLSQNVNSDYNLVHKSGLLRVSGSLNSYVDVEGFISMKDRATIPTPKHVPQDIDDAFTEGAKCQAIECFNASATMFRLCIDLATRGMLPEQDCDGLNARIRRSLGLRLAWLLNTARLPDSLRELSTSVKEDGDDGAHQGSISKADAEDLLDFTVALLERLYTEPQRLKLAKERRDARRLDANSTPGD